MEGSAQSVQCHEVSALRAEVEELRGQVVLLSQTLSRFVVSERKEKYYQAILEETLNAGHLRIENVGETDITTEDAHIEIKRWRDFDKVIGQLRRYQMFVKKARLCTYFFGSRPNDTKVRMIEKLLKEAGIEMYSFNADDSVKQYGKAEGPFIECKISQQVIPDNDLIESFIEKSVVKTEDAGDRVSQSAMYAAFKKWYAGQNAGRKVPPRRLTMRLRTEVQQLGAPYDAKLKIDGTCCAGFRYLQLQQ